MGTTVPKAVPFQGEAGWGLRNPNCNPLTLMREPAQPRPVFSGSTSLFVSGCPWEAEIQPWSFGGSNEETLFTESHFQSPQMCVPMEKASTPPFPDPGIRDDNRNPRERAHCLTTVTPLTRGCNQLGPILL